MELPTVSTAAAAVATAASATAATATPVFPGLGFFNNNGTAIEFRIIQLADGVSRLVVIVHFDKTETFGPAGKFVHNDVGRRNGSEFFESLSQAFAFCVEAEFCNKNIHKKKLKMIK